MDHHQYGPHELQRIVTYVQQSIPQEGYWVIYIHGGAWRDPTQTAESFEVTQSILSTSSRYSSIIHHNVIAFASIDYRLSSHPNFPQDHATTDPSQLREAKHPDHLRDVQTAISYLQDKCGFTDNYLLVGHSCGATLAFQTVMGCFGGDKGVQFAQPRCVVGVEGIYDLKGLRDEFKQHAAYQEFLESAFGKDDVLWDSVSPANVQGADGVEGGWSNGRLAVLAHSLSDGLVDFGQTLAMNNRLIRWKEATEDRTRNILFLEDVQGSHDEIWSKGEEMAKIIVTALQYLRDIESS